eukprot:6077505-Pleurochrysis_carterae.AAC.3
MAQFLLLPCGQVRELMLCKNAMHVLRISPLYLRQSPAVLKPPRCSLLKWACDFEYARYNLHSKPNRALIFKENN